MNLQIHLVEEISKAKKIYYLVEVGFEYQEAENKMACGLCSTTFSCPDPEVINQENQQKFYNLKKALKNIWEQVISSESLKRN